MPIEGIVRDDRSSYNDRATGSSPSLRRASRAQRKEHWSLSSAPRPSAALFARAIDAEVLGRGFTPRFAHPHKQRLIERACPDGPQRGGTVTVSRWPQRELPSVLPPLNTEVVPQAGLFEYGTGGPSRIEWHVNFAHSDVFAFYGGQLLAQDELQTLEHPILGSVREFLLAEGLSTATEDHGSATPILVAGTERRLALDTMPAPGRWKGLYGNRFTEASWEEIEAALTIIEPPTISNILAMAAPSYGHGRYTAEQIQQILATAYTGFAAVMDQSRSLTPEVEVVIHTGFWGCGAFGGNRVLMSALQILAANLAGVPQLRFYAFDSEGRRAFEDAVSLVESVAAQRRQLSVAIGAIAEQGLAWGTSDGN